MHEFNVDGRGILRGGSEMNHRSRYFLVLSVLCASVVHFSLRDASAAEPAVPPPITAIALAPDGKSVLAGSQAGLRQLSFPDLKAQGGLKTSLEHIHGLAFSPGGDLLAAAGGAPAAAGVIEVFAWPDGKLKYRVEPHGDLVYAIAWSPDRKHLATASYDHTVQVLDAATGKRIHKLEGHSRGVLAVCYLPDGKALVSAGADNSLRVWDAAGGRPLRTLDNHTAMVNDLAVRPGEKEDAPPLVVSVSDDRTVRLWKPTIGRMVRFARLTSAPLAVAWSRDGKTLAAACADGRLRVLDGETLESIAEQPAIDGRAYSIAAPRKESSFVVGGAKGALKVVRTTAK
jgi:WD40 repeat protein